MPITEDNFYFKIEDLLPKCTENLTDPWLEWAHATIPGKFINSAASAEWFVP